MLEIKNDTIYLTKGDTGIINIEVTGSDVSDKDLRFTVRNAVNLDNVMFTLVSGEAASDFGEITHDGGNKWTVTIYTTATTELKRKKYFYDFAIEGDGDKTTFVGGGVNKTEFWVT